MDLSALRIFKAIAEEGSVTRAATRLHRVQSNVSARLAQLEEALGVPLFHRAGRRLLITTEGERLLTYADRLLQLSDEAQAAVRGGEKPSGQLKIGSMETTAAVRLPGLLAGFHRRYPDVDLVLETGSTDAMVQAVFDHRLDVALVTAPISRPELDCKEVFEEELVLLTHGGHGAVRVPADVEKKVLLGFRAGCTYRRRLESWFTDAGIHAFRMHEFGTFEAIIGCVAAGMGVAMMPKAVIQQRKMDDAIRFHALPPAIANIKTLLVWRKNVTHHPARQAFADSFGNLSRSDDADGSVTLPEAA